MLIFHTQVKIVLLQPPGDTEGQGSLRGAVHGEAELDMTEQLNNTTKCTFSLL